MSEMIGRKAPDFSLKATGGRQVNLREEDKTLVVYFYPKDATPGCTQEGKDFTKLYKDIQNLKCDVFGVSRDSLKSHENFKSKQKYVFELISDPDSDLCKAFDVLKEKSLFGKKYLGIERSTFILHKGKIVKEWRKVNVKDHAKEVLDYLKTLKN